jgi:hypothetical protein
MKSVYSAVGTGSLNKAVCAEGPQRNRRRRRRRRRRRKRGHVVRVSRSISQ